MAGATGYTKFVSSFWNSNVAEVTGFDEISDYLARTFEMASAMVNLIDSKINIDDLYTKSLSKVTKQLQKAEKNSKIDVYSRMVCEVYDKENNSRIAVCESSRQRLEHLKECLKKFYDRYKKNKGECSKLCKERKNAYEGAVKSCKMYTSKYRAHDAFLKKCPNLEEDEKLKSKVAKSQAGVTLAEKEARVSIEMLKQCMLDWSKIFYSYCQFAEESVREMHASIQQTLWALYSVYTEYTQSLEKIYQDFKGIADDTNVEEYMQVFLHEKGTTDVFSDCVLLDEFGEADKKEFYMRFCMSDEAPQRSQSHSTIAPSPRTVDPSAHATGAIPNDGTFPPGTNMEALFDYVAQADDELSFQRGDTIKVLCQEDESWYMGELPNGSKGIFPITYAKAV